MLFEIFLFYIIWMSISLCFLSLLQLKFKTITGIQSFFKHLFVWWPHSIHTLQVSTSELTMIMHRLLYTAPRSILNVEKLIVQPSVYLIEVRMSLVDVYLKLSTNQIVYWEIIFSWLPSKGKMFIVYSRKIIKIHYIFNLAFHCLFWQQYTTLWKYSY